MAANPNYIDIDQQETDDWIESLHSVIERDGIDRAHFLLETLIEEARRSGAYLPYSANTAYLNTIPETSEVHTPGDPAIEWRIRSLIRWNALAMVMRANDNDDGDAGDRFRLDDRSTVREGMALVSAMHSRSSVDEKNRSISAVFCRSARSASSFAAMSWNMATMRLADVWNAWTS